MQSRTAPYTLIIPHSCSTASLSFFPFKSEAGQHPSVELMGAHHGKVTGTASSQGAAWGPKPCIPTSAASTSWWWCRKVHFLQILLFPWSSVTKGIQCHPSEETCVQALLGKGAEEACESPMNLWDGVLICAVHQGILFFLGTVQHPAQVWFAASSLACNRHKIAINGALFPIAFPGS